MTESLRIPKRGQYLLLRDWEIDLYDDYDENGDIQMTPDEYDRWKWQIKWWVDRGCKQISKTAISIPAGVCVTLDAIKVTTYHDTIVFKFHTKYNNLVRHGRLDLSTSEVEEIPAAYLTSKQSTEYAKLVKKGREHEFEVC